MSVQGTGRGLRRGGAGCVSRRGSVYLALLICCMIVTVVGLSALTVSRVRQRTVDSEVGFAESRLAARSAVELGLLWVNTEADWRSHYTNGAWVTNQSFGGGTFSLSGQDPVDGNIGNSASDPVVLTGTGESGGARYMLKVRLQPQPGPIDALRSAIVANGPITVEAGKMLTLDNGPLTTNGQLRVDGSVVGDVAAMTIAGAGTITDADTVQAVATPMPPSTVVTDYAAKGTTILKSGAISDFSLGPSTNPWGATNAEGVYVIDTQGSDIDISRAVVSGTLIIRAPGRRVRLQDAVYFKNYRADYPTLIVDGDLEVDLDSSGGLLSGVLNGVADLLFGTNGQQYPKRIDGLVHVKGSLKLVRNASVKGAVICEGTVDVSDTNRLIWDRSVFDVPPVGYTNPAGRMAVVAGTWQQVTLP